jgi:hypothetical protein
MAVVAPPRAGDNPGQPASDRRATGSAPERRRRWQPPSLSTLFTAVFALFGWGVGIERLSDNSFFWHLRTGEYILDHGIPHSDIYSFTAPGVKWVAQSWLAELLYGALDRGFGPFAIRVLGGIVGALIGVLAFRLALRLSRERVRAALLTVAALGGLYTLWSERPLLLGVLFLLVLLWVVEVPDSLAGRHPYVSLPILFWLWANVHGTFALGFAYLALHLIGRCFDGARPDRGRERTLLVASAISLGVTFVNPYGLSLVLFPIDLLSRGDILRHIVEWGSPDFHSVRGQSFILWVAVFAVVLARGARRVSRRDLTVALPFLALALWALRNVALAPLVCLPIAARAVAVDESDPRSEQSRAGERRTSVGWALALVLAIVATSLGLRASSEPNFELRSYPVAAMQAVERQGLLGQRLLTDDADAGYVILAYYPQQKVFIDDRYDMYPRSVINAFFALSNGDPGWAKTLDRYKVNVVVWDREKPLAQYLAQDSHWHRTYRDHRYVIYVRNGVSGTRPA